MNTKNNRRFQETEVMMEAAMLELMKSREQSKITVKDVCEKAKVNRSTFYAHFIDIYDMMDKMEEELHRQLLASYQKLEPKQEERTLFSQKSLLLFLNHIKDHQYFYRILLKTRTNYPLKEGFEPLWNRVFLPLCRQAGITKEEDILYYLIYFQAGFTMVLRHWVEEGCRKPQSEVAEIIRKCIPLSPSSPYA